MGVARSDDDDQLEVAIDDLLELARGVPGLDVVSERGDLVQVHRSSGQAWPAQVIVAADLRESDVRTMAATAGRSSKIVVADTVTAGARAALAELHWGWIDRSWGAYLVNGVGSPGTPVIVHFRDRSLDGPYSDGVPGRFRGDSGSDAIRGRAGISLAAALLIRPNGPPSLREVAGWSSMSPQSMSNAAKRLTEHGLIDEAGIPVLPDLFSELVNVWRPQKVVAVAEPPHPDLFPADQVDGDPNEMGVALGGDLAAAALGAPLVTSDSRPWLWVPSLATINRVARRLGTTTWDRRAGVLALPPTQLVTMWRHPRRSRQAWPLVHGLFAALDLARTPGRGDEILEDFHPEGVTRVWAQS